MADRLLDPNEVAKRLGMTRRGLEKLAEPPPSFKVGKLRRFSENALDRWIAERTAEAA